MKKAAGISTLGITLLAGGMMLLSACSSGSPTPVGPTNTATTERSTARGRKTDTTSFLILSRRECWLLLDRRHIDKARRS